MRAGQVYDGCFYVPELREIARDLDIECRSNGLDKFGIERAGGID
jgi:hypothetical protein